MRFQTLISAEELRRLAGNADTTIVDCRFDLMNPDAGRQVYEEAHIPGAQYADLNDDLSSRVTSVTGRHPLPEPTAFAVTLARLGVRPGVQVVAYDASGGTFAARLWWMLHAWGHAESAVLDGGYPAWTSSGGRVVSGVEPAAAIEALPSRMVDWPVMTTARVDELRQDLRYLLVDARASERYTGLVEPIDAVAGHVPGAVNHPFAMNLGHDGRFLPRADLRQRWQARLGGREPAKVVAMCGSGVTACHNLLSMAIAGLSGAALYAGSWSEWIRDSRRPTSRGDSTV